MTGNLKKAVGALIQDHNGNWISKCYWHNPKLTNLEAELWVLRDGLHLAHSLNIVNLEIKVDATAIISLIADVNDSNALLSILIDYRMLMTTIQPTEIKHTVREGKQNADALARLGNCFQANASSNNFNFVDCLYVCNGPPKSISFWLAKANGLHVMRTID